MKTEAGSSGYIDGRRTDGGRTESHNDELCVFRHSFPAAEAAEATTKQQLSTDPWREEEEAREEEAKKVLPPLLLAERTHQSRRGGTKFFQRAEGGGVETTSHFLTDDASFREKKPCCSPNFPPSPLPHGLGVARRVNYVAKNPLTQKFLLKKRSK